MAAPRGGHFFLTIWDLSRTKQQNTFTMNQSLQVQSPSKSKKKVLFNDSKFRLLSLNNKNKVEVVFGNVEIDMRKVELSEIPQVLNIEVVFGSATVILPADLPVKIKSSAVLASIRQPDLPEVHFGEQTSQDSDFFGQGPILEIRAKAVFGNIEIFRDGENGAEVIQ